MSTSDEAGDDFELSAVTVVRLMGGSHCRIEAAGVTLISAAGQRTPIVLDDITALNRGGRDVSLTRRARDPITFTTERIDDARRLEAALQARLPHADHRAQRRWSLRHNSRETF